jgi:hypothetical protein
MTTPIPALEAFKRHLEAKSNAHLPSGPDEIELVYSYLLANFRRTAKGGPEEDQPRNAALWSAIECFEAEWPAACEQFRKRFSR